MHRLLPILTGIAAGASTFAAALAADPVRTDPGLYGVVLENDRVRVLEYRDMPGARTAQHGHPAFVLVALAPFRRSITLADGRVLQRSFEAGDVLFSEAQLHIGENTGDTPTHAILIELK